MRVAACVLVVMVSGGCGSAEPGAQKRYGISIDAHDGWDVEISRSVIRIRRDDVSVLLREYEPTVPGEAVHFDDPWPVRLQQADFGRRGDAEEDDAYLTAASGRYFSVAARAPAPSADELDGLNRTLASIAVEGGDHFPGTVEPLRFTRRSGWFVAESGPGDRRAHGELVTAWAATIPYRDYEGDGTPRRTIAALPADGIVMHATLMRDRLWKEHALFRPPPYRFREFVRRDCPGKACEFPEYLLVAAYGERYRVEVRIYFGRERPTPRMVSAADSMLGDLRFPDWGAWELDPA